MTSIDPTLYEAASIDGAGRFQRILHVTLPGIKSTFVVLLIMNIGHLMEAGFEIQYLLGNKQVYDFSQTLDVTLTVDEPIPEVELQQEEEKEKMSPVTIMLIILCVALVAGLVVQGTILTKKIHTLEEERL